MMFDPQRRKESQAARISMALFRISQSIKKLTQSQSDDFGLSPVQIQALLFVHHTRSDVASVGNFAKTIGTTHVTAVKIINGLVQKGMIAKAEKTEDRRVTVLSLTPAGEETASRLENWGEALEETLDHIPADVLSDFETGLGAIVSALQKEGHLVVAEPCLGCVHFRPNTGDEAAPHYCAMIKKYLTHEASRKECPEHTPSS